MRKHFAQDSTDERWQYIGQSTSKEKYYIDVLTQYKMDDEFGVKEVWIKCISPITKLNKNGKTLIYSNTVELTLYEINCSKNEMKAKQDITYDSKAKIIDSWENEFSSFRKAAPGSIGEMILEESCKIH